MQALVTGGAGFIGSTLVDRLLAEDWKVDVVDDLSSGTLANLGDARTLPDRRFSFHRLDVASAAVVELIDHRKPDVIFHLAAQMDVRVSVARPVFDAMTNVIGSLNIFEGARAAGVQKIVFAGSGGTLYGSPQKIPTKETAAQHPESPYGVAKKAVGDYLYYYRAQHGLEYTVLALANVFGPRQNPHGEAGVVAIFADMFLDRKAPVIFGDGSQTRDFVYVDDVVDAFVRAATKGGGLTMNIGTSIETSVREIYDLMGKLTGFHEPARIQPARTGELARSAIDPGKAEIHLGWKPFTPLEEGLARTLEYVKAVREAAR
jgi:UDP-glucose 4-epimerase